MSIDLIQRSYDAEKNTLSKKIPPLIQRILCGRGIYTDEEIDFSLGSLPSPDSLQDIDKAAIRLANAIENQEKIIIVADYDVDGACSAALALRVLYELQAQRTKLLMPDRSLDGYGLSEELVHKKLLPELPALIITVDNGIKSHEAVKLLRKAGADVIITDHHTPVKELPSAYAVINPKRPDSSFPSVNLAGVGVCFYLLCRLRRILIQRQYFLFQGKTPINMADFLDLVALGTVADIVSMDRINRVLTEQGLRRIRRGKTSRGIRVLLQQKDVRFLNSEEIRFTIIPRLNAVGRLGNMELGVRCLMTDSPEEAQELVKKILDLNQQRKNLAANMLEQAMSKEIAEKDRSCLCLYDERWPLGLTGPLAATLKNQHNCPVIVFAKNHANRLTGSGRSINGICLHSLLMKIDAENEGLLLRFGGHSQAVGLTISASKLTKFKQAFKNHAKNAPQTQAFLLTDGELAAADIKPETATQLLTFAPWGKDFPPPLFVGDFELVEQALTPSSHLKLQLRHKASGSLFTAFKFFQGKKDYPLKAQQIKMAYSLMQNPHSSNSLYLKIKHINPL